MFERITTFNRKSFSVGVGVGVGGGAREVEGGL